LRTELQSASPLEDGIEERHGLRLGRAALEGCGICHIPWEDSDL